jgi:superfamily I DNA/RNA helicase
MEERVEAQLDPDSQVKVKCATIHSLAFEHIGMKKHYMVNTLYAFAKHMGVRSIILNDRMPVSAKTPLEKAISHYHIQRTQLYEGENALPKNMSWEEYNYYVQEFETWKDANKFCDYTDVLVRYLNDGEPFEYDVAIVDEAQDLSKLQWAVVEKMFGNAKDLITAGDDDQTIYAFAGVRAYDFIHWPCDKTEVLHHSFRLGKDVHQYTHHVLERIEHRVPKVFEPSDHKSEVKFSNTINPEVDILPYQTCAILHRNGYLVRKTRDRLNKLHLTYSGKGSPFNFMTAMRAIRYWEDWRKGEETYASQVHLIGKFLPDDSKIDRMEDKGRKSLAPPCPYPYRTWDQVLDLPFKEVYKGVEEAFGLDYLLAPPKIEVTTIHQAKGGEWDKVIVVTDMSTATWKEFNRGGNQDAEHRVWYTALTRAKKALQILLHQTKKFYPLKEG